MDNCKKDFTPKNQFIAYIDVLGYEQKVKEIGTKKLAEVIYQTIEKTKEHIERIANTFDGTESKIYNSTILIKSTVNFKVFSDNFIICTDTEDFPSLIQLVENMQRLFLEHNIFIRGALCYGELYFDDTFICGQGIIDAYRIESEIALFPRIIVDRSCFQRRIEYSKEIINLEPIMYNDVLCDFDRHIGDYITKDFDGFYFIDYLKSNDLMFKKVFSKVVGVNNEVSKSDLQQLLEEQVLIHKNIIEKNLKENKNRLKILQKYEWCRSYYNNFCEKYGYHNLII